MLSTPVLCGREGARKCGVEEIMTIKWMQESMSGDQLTSTSWDTLSASDIVQDLVNMEKEPLERNNEGLKERRDPLIRFQELRERIAEMKKEVNKEEVRKMELRRQLEGAKCDEFDERCKDSGNGSISTDDVINPVLPAVLFPSGGEVGTDYM